MGEQETERKGRKQTKKPLFQHSTNVLDHGTLFPNSTINTSRIPAFLRTEVWKTGKIKNIGDVLLLRDSVHSQTTEEIVIKKQ